MPLNSSALAKGDTATLGIRPEHFVGEDSAATMIDLGADVVERMGDMCYIYGESDTGEEIIVQRNFDRETRSGDTLKIGLPVEKLLLFDGQGQRIR